MFSLIFLSFFFYSPSEKKIRAYRNEKEEERQAFFFFESIVEHQSKLRAPWLNNRARCGLVKYNNSFVIGNIRDVKWVRLARNMIVQTWNQPRSLITRLITVLIGLMCDYRSGQKYEYVEP